MKAVLALALIVVASLFASPASAQSFPAYGCPPELQGNYPEPRACVEDQSWWQKTFNPATFPFESMHVHTNFAFPYGERVVLPPAGETYSWKMLAIFHNQQGASVRGIRGGGWQQGCDGLTYAPGVGGTKITTQDQRITATLTHSACSVNVWRNFSGTKENRFTTDISSADAGKRQYTSCSCNAQFNVPAKLVTKRTRSWYQGLDYGDLIFKTPFSATTLANGSLPNMLSYSLASGATMASAYINPDFHHGEKGTVLFENRVGTTGTFTLPSLPPGDYRLVLVGIEKAGLGAQGAASVIPFKRN